MGENVSVHMLRRLHQWGVDRIYGYPGDGINGLVGAFHEVGDEIEFVQTRHEELAAFMACAHAKLTGEVGVCMATSGPGAIHLLNGLYDAKLDHAPVVAIVGHQKTISLGGHYQQEVDLVTLFKDVASEYVQVCMAPAQASHLIDRAYRIAQATRSVTCVIVPADIQEEPHEEPPRAHGTIYSGGAISKPRVIPHGEDLQRAAVVLNEGQRVAMLIGQGARGAEAELVQAADLLGCGIARALNGRDVLPDDLPFVTGSVGLLGSKPSDEMMRGSGTNWWAQDLRLRSGMRAALSGTLATMCPALPYAVAAKFAYPDRPVIAFEGDGSMQMNGINALIDAAKYYDRWSDPRLVVLVLNNHDLNQVTWEQRVLAGDPKLEASQLLPDFPFADYARMLGLDGVRVDDPSQIRAAWERALKADRPFVFEAVYHPHLP